MGISHPEGSWELFPTPETLCIISHFSRSQFILSLILNIQYTITMRLALKKPQDVPGRSWPAIVIGFFVAFGGILFG